MQQFQMADSFSRPNCTLRVVVVPARSSRNPPQNAARKRKNWQDSDLTVNWLRQLQLGLQRYEFSVLESQLNIVLRKQEFEI